MPAETLLTHALAHCCSVGVAAVVTIKIRGPLPVDDENFLLSVCKDTVVAPDQSTPRFKLEVTKEEKGSPGR